MAEHEHEKLWCEIICNMQHPTHKLQNKNKRAIRCLCKSRFLILLGTVTYISMFCCLEISQSSRPVSHTPDNPNQALQLVRQRRTRITTYAPRLYLQRAHMIFDPLFGSHTPAPITRPLLCTPLDLIFHCPCTAHCGLRLHLVAIVMYVKLWLSGDHSKISIKVFHSTTLSVFCHLNSV